MALIPKRDLDFWIKHNLNVLFEGKAGVGKTSVILEAFQKHGLKVAYFSASTMDPWVDFIGVPKETILEDGTTVLRLVRPEQFAKDEIDVIIADELNRAPKKVLNALMELIQFKQINGHKFSRLKMVWAAINPIDDKDHDYQVEELDPAQKDRFHIHFKVPYLIDKEYFNKKYPIYSRIATEWWDKLDVKLKNLISPRRMDYVVDIFSKNGNIKHVLPSEAPIAPLIKALTEGPVIETLFQKLQGGTKEEISELLENDYAVNAIKTHHKRFKSNDFKLVFECLSSDERRAVLLTDNGVIQAIDTVVTNNDLKYLVENNFLTATMLKNANNQTATSIVGKIKQLCKVSLKNTTTPAQQQYLSAFNTCNVATTGGRYQLYTELCKAMDDDFDYSLITKHQYETEVGAVIFKLFLRSHSSTIASQLPKLGDFLVEIVDFMADANGKINEDYFNTLITFIGDDSVNAKTFVTKYNMVFNGHGKNLSY